MMKLYLSICIFLFAPCLISAQEGNLEKLVELEWLIYTSEDTERIQELLLEKARVLKTQANYEASLMTLDRITTYPTSKFEAEVINERILLHFLIGNDAEVKNLILQTLFIDGYEKTTDILLVESLNYCRLHELKNAEQALMSLSPKVEGSKNLFEGKKFKNPETAFMLSFFTPGLGQMYAGKPIKGIVSLGLNVGLFYAGLNGIKRKFFFTEAVPSIALFQGFFFGGAEYAKRLAIEKNEETVRELSEEILDLVK